MAKTVYWNSERIHSETSKDRLRAINQEVLVELYGTVITNSMMLSQTAFDVHAFFEAFLDSQSYTSPLDRKIRRIMGKVIERIVKRGDYHHVSTFLDFLRRGLAYSDNRYCLLQFELWGERAVERMYKKETCHGAIPSEQLQHAFTVAVAAVLHLLAFVFQYLIGYTDRGGTKTYSSGCFDFRASFVSVLLFLAAFVWIKFRQAAARPSTGKRKQPEHPTDDANDTSHVYPRKSGYEARYTIPVKMRDKAHPVECDRLTLGLYKTREEAAFVWRVAETRYEDKQGTCCVALQGEPHTFPVPAMSEQEQGLVGEEKRQWVMKYAKDVGKKEYAKFAMQLDLSTGTGSHDRFPSRRTRQPSLMLAYTAHQPLNGLEAPSCSNVPHQPRSVETVSGELNPGWQPIQEQHEVRTQNLQGRVISEGVVSTSCENMLPRSPAMADCDHHPEGGTLDGYYSDFAQMLHSGVEAAEQGSEPQSGPLRNSQQGMCPANPVQQNVAFESAIGEQSESEQRTIVQQQQQQPQAYGEEFLDYQQVSKSQNPGLQQVYTPSQQISDRLVEKDPSVINSELLDLNKQLLEVNGHLDEDKGHLLEDKRLLLEENGHLFKDNDRLRKEKELCEQEIERLRKEKELSDEENERLRKEKELSDEKMELCEQEIERLRKVKELPDEKMERLREENKRLSDAIVALVAPKSK